MLDYQVNIHQSVCAVGLLHVFIKRSSESTSLWFSSSPLSLSWTPGLLACSGSTPRPGQSLSRLCGSTWRPTNCKTLTSASSSTVTSTCSRWGDVRRILHIYVNFYAYNHPPKTPGWSVKLEGSSLTWLLWIFAALTIKHFISPVSHLHPYMESLSVSGSPTAFMFDFAEINGGRQKANGKLLQRLSIQYLCQKE